MSTEQIAPHEHAEQAFLDALRRRVHWQAAVAYPQLATRASSAWSLWELERLVAERGARCPDRVDEWRWHLRYLRFHAAADGSLPPEFDEHVRGVFGELL